MSDEEKAISMLEQIGRHECIWMVCRHNEVYEAIDMAIDAIQKVQRLEYLINTHKQKGHSPHYSVTMEDLSYLLDMKEGDENG